MAPAMVLISIKLAAMAIALASVGAGAHPWCSAREPSTGAATTLTTVSTAVSSAPSARTAVGGSSTSSTAGPGTTSTTSSTSTASPPQRTCDPGHQRLVDPGFEDNVAGGPWLFLPDSMVVPNSTDHPAHTGSRAVLNDIRDTGDGTQFSQQLAGLDPGLEYTVSLWWALTAQQGMGDGACEIAIQLDGQVIGGVSIPPGGAFAWSRSDQHTARPAVPDPVLAIHLTCFAFFGFTSVDILVDDVSLTCV